MKDLALCVVDELHFRKYYFVNCLNFRCNNLPN